MDTLVANFFVAFDWGMPQLMISDAVQPCASRLPKYGEPRSGEHHVATLRNGVHYVSWLFIFVVIIFHFVVVFEASPVDIGFKS